MTAICSQSFIKNADNGAIRFYSVVLVTFDGDTIFDEIEAISAENAVNIALSIYDNIDYAFAN